MRKWSGYTVFIITLSGSKAIGRRSRCRSVDSNTHRLGSQPQRYRAARLLRGLVEEAKLHDALGPGENLAAGVQDRFRAVDDGAAARQLRGDARIHFRALAGDVVRLAAGEVVCKVQDHGEPAW